MKSIFSFLKEFAEMLVMNMCVKFDRFVELYTTSDVF